MTCGFPSDCGTWIAVPRGVQPQLPHKGTAPQGAPQPTTPTRPCFLPGECRHIPLDATLRQLYLSLPWAIVTHSHTSRAHFFATAFDHTAGHWSARHHPASSPTSAVYLRGLRSPTASRTHARTRHNKRRRAGVRGTVTSRLLVRFHDVTLCLVQPPPVHLPVGHAARETKKCHS